MNEDAYKNIAVKLKEKSLQYQIIIMDVKKLMDEQNLVESTRGIASDFYSKYHPLDEVTTKRLYGLTSVGTVFSPNVN